MPKNKTKKPSKPTTAIAVTAEYIKSQKMKDWTRLFFDKSHPETYGNATKCALKVYNTESYHSAGQIGHENLKKLENMRLAIADNEGFGFGDLMKIGIAKMAKGEFGDWDKFMVRLGYFEPEPGNIQATQNNFNFNFATMGDAIAASRKERGLAP